MRRFVLLFAVLAAGLAAPAYGHNDSAALDEAVSRAVAPLREQIAEERARVRLRDAAGGIGYIIGLAGLAAYLKSRPRRSGESS